MSEGYVDIKGVKTWHDRVGSGPPLVLLHGGLSGSFEWEPFTAAFAKHFTVHTYDRRAHGRSSDPGPFSFALMAEDLIVFLEEVVKGPASLVGWSDGGIIGLVVAARRPDLVTKLVAFGANIRPDGVPEEIARGFAETPVDAPDMAPMREAHAALSPDGASHWDVLFEKEKTMMMNETALATDDLGTITAPTLVVAGDDDIVTIEHSTEIYRGIRDAQLAIIPGASHFLQMEKPQLFLTIVKDFLLNDPAPTMMPFRRGHT